MRILYVTPGYGAEHIGYEIHRELAQEIMSRGHTFCIFALARQNQMEGRKIDDSEEGVPVHRAVCSGRKYQSAINRVSKPLFKFPWFVTAFGHLLSYLRLHPDLDIIMADSVYPMGALVNLATLGTRTPFMPWVAGGDVMGNPQANYGYARYPLPRFLMRATFKRAAVVRAVSPQGAKNAQKLGCRPEKMALVQWNVGQTAFLPQDTPADNYRRLAREAVTSRYLVTSPHLIVCVGRLLPIKGFDDLVSALPRVRARVGDVWILHVGPNRVDSRLGDYQMYLEQLATSLGVANSIVFAGSVPYDQVRDFLTAADVVAIPSVEEGGTKMVMEAAAAGTPFVATSTAGTSELARDWNCGLIVEPRAPDQLAEALIRILSDPVKARQMGTNGLQFAEQFRVKVVADRLLSLCECARNRMPVPVELRQFSSSAAGGAQA
jgi:glycosyltransferase involved in cell wall biosynthesis